MNPVHARRLLPPFALVAIALIAMAVVNACSSSDETPVPPTALPTSAPDATEVPDSPAPTQSPASPTSAPSTPTSPPATATSEPEDLLFTLGLLATGEVDPNRFTKLEPGEAPLLDRAYPGAPPLVPHRADDLAITPSKNSCMECHETGKTINGDVAVQVPISHYTDFTTGTVGNQLYGGRYVCTSCHVPQVIDEPPAVSSD